MSARENNGGPAFPALYAGEAGMTLRDYFAAQALSGISPRIEAEIDKFDPDGKYFHQRLSEWYQLAAIRSYCYADAMLAARKEGKK